MALRSLCQELQDYEVLALDVETALDFVTLCLLQVATPGHTCLIDPFAVADLSPLAAVFGTEQPVKVIHNAGFEKRVLKASGLALCGVFDTMVESKRIRPGALMATPSQRSANAISALPSTRGNRHPTGAGVRSIQSSCSMRLWMRMCA